MKDVPSNCIEKWLHRGKLRYGLAFVLVMTMTQACVHSDSGASRFDPAEVSERMKSYREAWMNGDSAEVMGALSQDFVLFMPGKQGKPVIGKDSARAFWFPKSEIRYPIVSYKVEHEEIDGDGDLAYYQGVSKLEWCTEEGGVRRDTVLSVSEFTNVLKRENGEWKLKRIQYNLKDPDYQRH